MISPERTGLLKSFLGGLPEQIAARLEIDHQEVQYVRSFDY